MLCSIRVSLTILVGGGFHRGFPLLSQSLAAAIRHTTSKDYSLYATGSIIIFGFWITLYWFIGVGSLEIIDSVRIANTGTGTRVPGTQLAVRGYLQYSLSCSRSIFHTNQ